MTHSEQAIASLEAVFYSASQIELAMPGTTLALKARSIQIKVGAVIKALRASLREEERPAQDGPTWDEREALAKAIREMDSLGFAKSSAGSNLAEAARPFLSIEPRDNPFCSPALSEGVEGPPVTNCPADFEPVSVFFWDGVCPVLEAGGILLMENGDKVSLADIRALGHDPESFTVGAICGGAEIYQRRPVPLPQEPPAPTPQQLLQTILNAFEAASDDMIAAPGFDVLQGSVIAAAARLVNRASAPVEEGR